MTMMGPTTMSRRHRVIRPETLANPESDLGLEDRASIEPEPEVPRGPSLAERIAAARRLEARPEDGCRDCWTHGRDAAVALIEAGEGVEEARALTPQGSELHWAASWRRGRDAALRIVEGE
jgi:hypothetical protein